MRKVHIVAKMHNRMLRFALYIAVVLGISSGCQVKKGQEDKPEPQIVLNSLEEARAFMQEYIDRPIPEDYDYPAYITSKLPLEQVYDSLAERYPDFYGLEGTAYVQAVQTDPHRYIKMITENKAIRKYYDKDSQY